MFSTWKVSILYSEDLLFRLDQIYYWIYNGKNIIIYTNMDVILFRTFSHMIIMTRKVDPCSVTGAGDITAVFLNRFVNEIFGNWFYQTFGRRWYFLDSLPKKSLKCLFSLQNRHLKPKIDCKNKGKWKLQTCFSWNYDFAFTNLLKNAAD